MLRDIDDTEATCDYHVEDGTLDQQEQCTICILTITQLGLVILTVDFVLVYSVRFQ